MKIDKSQFQQHFDFERLPEWQCPTCFTGRIIKSQEGVNLIESAESKSLYNHEEFSGDWVHGWFTGVLICNSCSENVVFSGKYFVDVDVNDDGTAMEYTHFIAPKYFIPSLQILPHVNYCNKAITIALSKSYELFWIDNSACANAIRKVVEAIMDEQKIEKTKLITKSGKSKRIRISLHKRLELFETKNKFVAELLLATKWIGNDGSHSIEILKREHIIKAFEILELSLESLYNNSTKMILKSAKAINKSKGIKIPRKKKRKFGIR